MRLKEPAAEVVFRVQKSLAPYDRFPSLEAIDDATFAELKARVFKMTSEYWAECTRGWARLLAELLPPIPFTYDHERLGWSCDFCLRLFVRNAREDWLTPEIAARLPHHDWCPWDLARKALERGTP